MRALILFAATVLCLGTSIAEARPVVEVTCYEQDCFKNGWSTSNHRYGFWQTTRCWAGDCTTHGWQTHDSRGYDLDVTCVGRGCFVDGWLEAVAQTRESQFFKCKAPVATPQDGNVTPNCWVHGFEANGPSVVSSATCLNGSCRTGGWVTKQRGVPDTTVVCKAGSDEATGTMVSDCFRFGWNVYQ